MEGERDEGGGEGRVREWREGERERGGGEGGGMRENEREREGEGRDMERGDVQLFLLLSLEVYGRPVLILFSSLSRHCPVFLSVRANLPCIQRYTLKAKLKITRLTGSGEEEDDKRERERERERGREGGRGWGRQGVGGDRPTDIALAKAAQSTRQPVAATSCIRYARPH